MEESPSDDELEWLSGRLGDDWKPLARRLRFHEDEITGFDRNSEYSEKAYDMLRTWKQRDDLSHATNKKLYEALRHQLVARGDLAKNFVRFGESHKSKMK